MLESDKLPLLGKLLILFGCISVALSYVAWRDSRANNPLPTTIATMQARGYLKCGVASNLPGLSVVNRDSVLTKTESLKPIDKSLILYSDSAGLEADICRAVAIGLFGTTENTLYYHLADGNWDTRMASVVDGTIDLLIRQVAIQPELGSTHEVDFSSIVYFDRMALLTKKEISSTEKSHLYRKDICVVENSYTASAAQTYSNNFKLDWKFNHKGPIRSYDQALSKLINNDCDAIMGRFSILYGASIKNPEVSEHHLHDLTGTPSMPTVGVVANSAYQFKGLVNHSIWTLMRAEATGQSSTNVSPEYNANFWYGNELNPDYPRRIIQQLGNYSDIYKRHFAEALPAAGPNSHYFISSSGRLLAPR